MNHNDLLRSLSEAIVALAEDDEKTSFLLRKAKWIDKTSPTDLASCARAQGNIPRYRLMLALEGIFIAIQALYSNSGGNFPPICWLNQWRFTRRSRALNRRNNLTLADMTSISTLLLSTDYDFIIAHIKAQLALAEQA